MQVKVHWIGGLEAGRLGIMPRPRGGDWLGDEILSLKSSGVGAVVSLLEDSEVEELDLAAERGLCEAEGISFLSFPIPDRGVPPSGRQAVEFAGGLSKLLRSGGSVVIHCRQGVGRSALVAACVLALGGVPVEEAFRRIEAARGCPVPDTPEQRSWVARLIAGPRVRRL